MHIAVGAILDYDSLCHARAIHSQFNTPLAFHLTTGVLTYYLSNGQRVDVTGLMSRIFKSGNNVNGYYVQGYDGFGYILSAEKFVGNQWTLFNFTTQSSWQSSCTYYEVRARKR